MDVAIYYRRFYNKEKMTVAFGATVDSKTETKGETAIVNEEKAVTAEKVDEAAGSSQEEQKQEEQPQEVQEKEQTSRVTQLYTRREGTIGGARCPVEIGPAPTVAERRPIAGRGGRNLYR